MMRTKYWLWLCGVLALLALGPLACDSNPARPSASPEGLAVAASSTTAPATAAAATSTATPLPNTPTPAVTATATQRPSPTAIPTATPLPADLAELVNSVKSALPAKAYSEIRVLPLGSPDSRQPYYAVYSSGQHNFDLKPVPPHFVAIYTRTGTTWQQLSRLDLNTAEVFPDYVLAVKQVVIDPKLLWLTVDGGAGAHSGTFELLSFDYSELKLRIAAFNPFSGLGSLQDVNGDGQTDVIINCTDPYVFCYACGVRQYAYQVFRWDAEQGVMREVRLQPLSRASGPALEPANSAVVLAQVSLWKEALAKVVSAKGAAGQSMTPADSATLAWDYGLIKLHADAMAEAVARGPYPVLANVFYGDYAAAVDLMRKYTPEQIFSAKSPLIVGTVAEQWVKALSERTLKASNAALEVEPDLAPAYYLRGWARYLANEADPQAKADVARAAQLAPNDRLYSASAAYLK